MKAIKLLLILYAGILLHCSNEFPRIHYTPKEDTGGSGIDLCKEKEREGLIDEGYYCDPRDGKVYENKCKNNNVENDNFCDVRDGKVYKFRDIGTQTWMAQNLNYDTERTNSRCYDNIDENCEEYGRLYEWDVALKVCPPGWHLPSTDEWLILENNVNFIYTVEQALKTKEGWDNNGNGEDYYGFSALPGGYCIINTCDQSKRIGRWWTSNELDNSNAFYYQLSYNGKIRGALLKEYFYSVRCVKDN
jgi:uncharacterized protein (TIGR02145 family)